MEHGAVSVTVEECSLKMRLRWLADNLENYNLKVGINVRDAVPDIHYYHSS